MYIIKNNISGTSEVNTTLILLRRIPLKIIKDSLKLWTKELASAAEREVKGSTLKSRSGRLARDVGNVSSFVTVETNPGVYVIRYRDTIAPYGGIHESGGIVEAKPGKYLAIPLRPSSTKKPLKEFKDTFLRKSKRGDGYTVFQRLDKSKIVPIFILRKQVKMPKRPWFSNAVEKAAPKLQDIINIVAANQSET